MESVINSSFDRSLYIVNIGKGLTSEVAFKHNTSEPPRLCHDIQHITMEF